MMVPIDNTSVHAMRPILRKAFRQTQYLIDESDKILYKFLTPTIIIVK